jgi:RNA polymerase sigma-70 factor (ECF subfamily)
MEPTSVSLLERLKRPTDESSWDRFAQLYAPLMFDWARRLGLQDADAADLVQDVFLVVVRKLPEFQYQPGRSFRGWLRTVLTNKWRDRPAAMHTLAAGREGLLAALADENGQAEEEERAYRHYLIGRTVELLRPEFSDPVWRAFTAYAVEGQPVEEVAQSAGLSVNSVYLAKSRVVSRLRRELSGLVE